MLSKRNGLKKGVKSGDAIKDLALKGALTGAGYGGAIGAAFSGSWSSDALMVAAPLLAAGLITDYTAFDEAYDKYLQPNDTVTDKLITLPLRMPLFA